MDETIREAVIAASSAAGEAVGSPVGEKLADFLERLAGSAIDGLGKRLASTIAGPPPRDDSLSAVLSRWRSRNIVDLLRRAQEILNECQVEAREVPAAFLVPLLEGASQTSEEELREWWASLLANGVQRSEARHPMWARILAQMSADDLGAFKAAAAATDREGVEFVSPPGRPDWSFSRPRETDARLHTLGIVEIVKRHDEAVRPERRADTAQLPWGVARLSLVGAQYRRAVMPRERA